MGIAAVALGDASLDSSADGNEVAYATASGPVPGAQGRQSGTDGSGTHTAKPASEVGVAQVPGIAHRRETVADVWHAGWRPGCLGDAVTEADHQLARRQSP